MSVKSAYKRVLLKASGEALMGSQGFGIDVSVADRIANDIKQARELGVEVGVVIGGGNIFRGVAVASKGGDRVTGDHMGMLATVINSLALRTSLHKIGVDAVVLSAIAMPEICESFSQRQATAYMDEGKVVIFAGGTGNPFFTTDLRQLCVQLKWAPMRFLKVLRLTASIPPIRRKTQPQRDLTRLRTRKFLIAGLPSWIQRRSPLHARTTFR